MPRNFRLSTRPRAYKRLPKELKAQMLDIWKINPAAEDQAVADRLGIARGTVEKFRHEIGLKRKCGRKHDVLRLDSDGGETYHREHPQRVPQNTLAERERRAAAADLRNYTQRFFGDPPPGYSALDQKRAGA